MTYPDNLFIDINPTLRGRRIVVRIDINTAIGPDGQPTDLSRLDAAARTLKELSGVGARVIALAHFGEKGESLLLLAKYLSKHVPNINFIEGTDWKKIEDEVKNLADGQIALLENVRTFQGEMDNDDGLARFFASFGDMYVNDAFPVSHRKQASVCAITNHSWSFFGPNMRRELTELTQALTPKYPCLLILGGAKLKTKLPLIEKYLGKGCYVYVGGAMVHNILKAKGYSIGESLYDPDYQMNPTVLAHEKLLVPIDVVSADRTVYDVDAIPPDAIIVDAGPKTIESLKASIKGAETVIMNGPIGLYEKGFSQGTVALLETMGSVRSATTIIGGGDTLTVLNDIPGKKPQFTFASLGGGAMLDFLTEGTLPAIDAVIKSRGNTSFSS